MMKGQQSIHTSLAENLLETFNIKYYNCNLYVYTVKLGYTYNRKRRR